MSIIISRADTSLYDGIKFMFYADKERMSLIKKLIFWILNCLN